MNNVLTLSFVLSAVCVSSVCSSADEHVRKEHAAHRHFLTWSHYSGKGDPEKAVYILDGEEMGVGRAGFDAVVNVLLAESQYRKRVYVFPSYREFGTTYADLHPELVRRVPFAGYESALMIQRQVDFVGCPEENELVYTTCVTNSIGMKFVPVDDIPRPETEPTFYNLDEVEKLRALEKEGFFLGMTEVTQSAFKTVMERNPSRFQGDLHPVESVTWYEAVEFCKRLSDLPSEKTAGRVYSLPTTAEWQAACQAGQQAGAFTPGLNHDGYGWMRITRGSKTSRTDPVIRHGRIGLFDMYGNVREWCPDRMDKVEAEKASGQLSDTVERPVRGGSWKSTASDFDLGMKGREPAKTALDDLGFRVLFRHVK